jgi:hypothetical protein
MSAIRKYESSSSGLSGSEKERKLADIIHQLTVLSALETEVFYLEIGEKLDAELIEKFSENHNHIKVLVARAQRLMGDEEDFDGATKELFESAANHIKEEDQSLFPKLKGCELDFDAIGKKMRDVRNEMGGKKS